MNHYLPISLLASTALLLCGCSDENRTAEELLPTSAIRFSPSLLEEESGRGTVTDNTLLQTGGFGVMGYLHTTGTTPAYATPNFMNGEHVSYTDSEWTYSPLKYWPTGSTDCIDFLAYAPYDDSHISVSGNTLTFTIDNDPMKQADLVVAAPVKDASRSHHPTGIAFSFSHLLARIQFTARCTNETNDLKINSLTLKVTSHNVGTVNLADDTPTLTGSGTATELSYMLTNDTHFTHEAIAPTNGEPTLLSDETKGCLLLLPTANAPTLEIHYTCGGTSYSANTTLNENTLQAGKSTTLNLQITPPAHTP